MAGRRRGEGVEDEADGLGLPRVSDAGIFKRWENVAAMNKAQSLYQVGSSLFELASRS